MAYIGLRGIFLVWTDREANRLEVKVCLNFVSQTLFVHLLRVGENGCGRWELSTTVSLNLSSPLKFNYPCDLSWIQTTWGPKILTISSMVFQLWSERGKFSKDPLVMRAFEYQLFQNPFYNKSPWFDFHYFKLFSKKGL